MAVKGPKSALTDFLDEQGIKITFTGKKQKDNEVLPYKKKSKKDYNKQPFEIINYKKYTPNLQSFCLEKITKNYKKLLFTQQALILFSNHLCKTRNMNLEFFNFLVEKMEDFLKISDISKIKEDFLFFEKKFRKIQFGFCGTLSESALNFIIKNNNPEELVLSGAFQIKDVNLNSNLKVLHLEDSKILDTFVDKINSTFTNLKELSLKNCLNLENASIKVNVEHLNLSNTKLKGKLVGDFISLDISNTQLELPDNLTKIVKLNISGTKINQLDLPDCCEYLDVSCCKQLTNLPINCNLKHLNISNCNFSEKVFLQIKNFKNLEFLDLSFTNVTDELVFEIIRTTRVNELLVFGCFNVSERVSEFAWANILDIKIVGSPQETKFLLGKTEFEENLQITF